MSHRTTLELPSQPLEDLKANIQQQTADLVSEKHCLTTSPNSIQFMLGDSQLGMYLMAGAAAGIMEHCVMYPIDSVKVSTSLKQL